MKTLLKHILYLNVNDSEIYGKKTYLMVWSPVDHCWFYEDQLEQMDKKHLKFLLKQEVVRIGLRNDSPDNIAIFLKDYGRIKNRELAKKLKK